MPFFSLASKQMADPLCSTQLEMGEALLKTGGNKGSQKNRSQNQNKKPPNKSEPNLLMAQLIPCVANTS